jgi:hypothetical protein
MELAIPLLALGGFFVYSNKENDEDNDEQLIEGMTNQLLPNTNVPPVNYPTLSHVSKENVEKYSQPNATTDKFFKPSIYNKYKNGPDQFGNTSKEQQFSSISGNTMDKDAFKHNNMTPYFGAKIKGRTVDADISESILDSMTGTGSQNKSKQEQAPLFKPQANMQFAHGAPNMTDFYESRVNPSMNMANVKPFEEQRVGPGLDKGYDNRGSGGFNSGMDARDKWADKTVDELRVKTNPKVTYGLENHQGPAYNYIKTAPTVETQGRVEKYLPDTYFLNTPDRWLTTTGLEKGQTSRAEQMQKDVNRTTTTEEYFGTGSNTEGTAYYVDGHHENSKKQQLGEEALGPANLSKHNAASSGDYGRDGYKLLKNNRTCSNSNRLGGVGGAFKSAMAPILDMLRPTRKENVVGNCRIYGDAGSTVPKPSVYNPADRTPTTIRETTEGKIGMNHLNIEGQRDGAYNVSKQTPITNERDTTNVEYTGNAVASNTGAATYNAAYNQRNNVNKTYKNRPNQGGMAILNNEENIHIDKKDHDRDNNRMWVPSGGVSASAIPTVETHGKMNMPQYYNNSQGCDRIQPELLNAFKQNPYTQSLNSYY